jgi:hypothetical protein
VDLCDVRVIELREELRLALETREALDVLRQALGQDFEGYISS